MLKRITPVIAGSALIAAALTVPARAEDKPILLGINTALQLQVGRDTLDGVRMAVEEINAKGGVLGRKLEVVTADEGESPKEGVAAVNKLTGDNNVNVLIGGYDSGVTLAELPHISRAQTIFLGTG
jgi:branched-chain amino acid transport system substrate-binding protein